MNECEQKQFPYAISSGNLDKTILFRDNVLPPVNLLDLDKFSNILRLDSMKEIIKNREVIFNNNIQNCCEILHNVININPRYSLEDCLKRVVYKLRKLQLDSRYDYKQLSVDQLVVYNRAIEADCDVYLIRVLWEIRLSNIDRDMFYRFRDYTGSVPPCYDRYEELSVSSWRDLYNGRAFYEAFEVWFLRYPLAYIDKRTCNYLMSDYSRATHLPDNDTLWFMSKIFVVSNKSYIPKSFMENKDPIFTDVRDRSSANLMWFIKFENCFKESEQALENTSIPNTVEEIPECIILDFNEYKTRKNLK